MMEERGEEEKIVLWEKSVEHDKITEKYVDKKRIYNEKQNYPELVVEDVLELFKGEIEFGQLFNWLSPNALNPEKAKEEAMQWYRERLYAILLKRGVNKWLFVRKLLIRLKKKYQYKVNELQKEMEEEEKRYKSGEGGLNYKEYWKLKGELKAYSEIRRELMLLCNTPRWVVWNWRKVGLVDTKGLQRGKARKWKELFEELANIKFRR